MKNIIEKKQLKQILKSTWQIDVYEILDAPRGFVAETFFVSSNHGEFFVKVIDATSRYIENILESLPVIVEMRDHGVLQISEILNTVKNTLAYTDKNTVIIVFKKIHGKSTWDYRKDDYFQLLQKIHLLDPSKFKNQIQKELFTFTFEIELLKILGVLKKRKDIQELTGVDEKYIYEVEAVIKIFRNVISQCKQTNFNLHITHGDAPGNIIENPNKDLYLIDWDDVLLAPIERDLWYHDGDPLITKYYPNYNKSELAYTYYLLRRFLDDLSGFLDEIFKVSSSDIVIHENAEGIKNDVTGWLLPLVKNIKIISES